MDGQLRLALDDLNDLSRNLMEPGPHQNRFYEKPEDVPLDVIREKINSCSNHILSFAKQNPGMLDKL